MAILNRIRKKAIIVVGLALFAFVLTGLVTNLKSSDVSTNIGVVNGQELDRKDFSYKVSDMTSRYRGQKTNVEVAKMIWDQQVKSTLFNQEVDKLGIDVSGAQVLETASKNLKNDATFQNDKGEFDKAKLLEFIVDKKENDKGAYSSFTAYELSLIEKEKQDIYTSLVKSGIGATILEGEQVYRDENEKVSFKYVKMPYSSIPDADVEPTDQELLDYVSKHTSEYKISEPSADVSYVVFKEKASQKDIQDIRQELTDLTKPTLTVVDNYTKKQESIDGFKNTKEIEDFILEYSDLPYKDKYQKKSDLPKEHQDKLFGLAKGSVYGPYKDGQYIKLTRMLNTIQMPDSVKVKHILITWEGLRNTTDITRTKDEAKKLADSIHTVIQEKPSLFKDLAAKFSSDNSNKDKAGDLGYFTANRMVKPFNDFCFEGKKGDTGVVETLFGYHIISVDDQKNPQRTVKLATVAKEIVPSTETSNLLFEKVSNFQKTLEQDPTAFSTKVKEAQYDLNTSNGIKFFDEKLADDLPKERSIVKWLHNSQTNLGDIKRFDVNDGYVIVQLNRRSSKGVVKSLGQLDQTKLDVLKVAVRNEKRAQKLSESIDYTTVKGDNALDILASLSKYKVKSNSGNNTIDNVVLSGEGSEPKVIATAFGLKENELSKPIFGNSGVYFVKRLKKGSGLKSLDSYTTYASRQLKKQRMTINTQLSDALQNVAEIQDNRQELY